VNWLAHFVLSPHDDHVRLGNWLADVLTRPEAAAVRDPRILAGLELHRRIDTLTDRHPAVLGARTRLPAGVRRYAGVVLDVAWDHLLAVDFERLAGRDLDGFVGEIHDGLVRTRTWMPSAVAEVSDRMIAEEWLLCYTTPAGYELTLRRISNRLSPRARAAFDPSAARAHLESSHAELHAAFRLLWGDLRR
jgi:acyl carrier protein phosphodiesterase